MYTYKVGGKKAAVQTLQESTDRVVVRTKNARLLSNAVSSAAGKKTLENFSAEVEFPAHDVTVLKTKTATGGSTTARDQAREVLKTEQELRFAGRVLLDPNTNAPVLYTENIFIKFLDIVKAEECEKILAAENLTIKERAEYAKNAFIVSAPEGTGLKIFDIANALLQKKEVELCHPELIRKKSNRGIHPRQWHLKNTVINGVQVNANVKADKAHILSQGENTIIAVIDDGVDINNPEFSMAGKVVAARDVTFNSSDPRPKFASEKHGTACSGVAAASGMAASGVAPKAKLMPIRLSNELGSSQEANAFKWAADHGADVISCSWGPEDGDWSNPADPLHINMVPLPDSTRLAMLYAVTNGRNGKGCVITYAAGNGNEDTRFDGYASSEFVMAIAASNDTNTRSIYSDFGEAVWCSFPSSDFEAADFNHAAPITPGIYTTDRVGTAGYNVIGDYTEDFGGTSSACPGVAGVVALILSANAELTWQQVRDVIKNSCDKIDTANGNYNASNRSKFYGFGKIDAERAVKNAIALKTPQAAAVVIKSVLVNPAGSDAGKEKVELLNSGNIAVDIKNWALEVKGKKELLNGNILGGKKLSITLSGSKAKLTNTGATINLLNTTGKIVHTVTYKKSQVKEGEPILF